MRESLSGKQNLTYFVDPEGEEHSCGFNWNLDKRKPSQRIVILSQ